MAATARTTFTFVDRLGKESGPSAHETLLTAGNFAAQSTLRSAFGAALANLTLLPLSKQTTLAAETSFSPTLPTVDGALIGIKFLCRAKDTNGNSVRMSIPGADLALAPGADSTVDLTAGSGLAFKTAWDAYALSNDGEATVLQQVIYLDK